MNNYFIEVNEPGFFRGWMMPNNDGSPSLIRIKYPNYNGITPLLFCSHPRMDVYESGFGLFSGFNVNITTSRRVDGLVAILGKKEFNLQSLVQNPPMHIHVERNYPGKIMGWIDSPEAPHSLIVSNGKTVSYAEFYERKDVSEFKQDHGYIKSGVMLEGINYEQVDWIVLNNKYVHFFIGDT